MQNVNGNKPGGGAGPAPAPHVYTLLPQQDITVFEMATIVAHLGLRMSERAYKQLPVHAQRHFHATPQILGPNG